MVTMVKVRAPVLLPVVQWPYNEATSGRSAGGHCPQVGKATHLGR